MIIEKKINAISLDLGESPIWVNSTQKFYFVDIKNPKIYSFEPCEQKLVVFDMPFLASSIVNIGTDKFLIASENKIYEATNEFKQLREKCSVNSNIVGKRFNDGAYDSNGYLWISGIASDDKNLSSIFKISLKNDVTVFEKNNVQLGNGIDWSHDKKKMFFNDSKAKIMYRYDFDKKFQMISNKKKFFDFNNFNGEPDGLTIDSFENIWVPIWNDGIITKISQEGKLLNYYNFPTQRPTSVAFSNDNKRTMLITTAKLDKENSIKTDDGCVFIARYE